MGSGPRLKGRKLRGLAEVVAAADGDDGQFPGLDRSVANTPVIGTAAGTHQTPLPKSILLALAHLRGGNPPAGLTRAASLT